MDWRKSDRGCAPFLQYKTLKTEQTMDCKTFRTQVADLFDKEVSLKTQTELQRHMDECESCRNYYEELASVADMLRPRHSPLQNQQKPAASHSWIKAAAIFAGVILAAGITAAAIHFAASPNKSSLFQEGTGEAVLQEEAEEAVRFSGVRLDSILTVVSAHYGKAVQFLSEEPRTMKLYTTWNPADSLQAFIGHLNMFDYLHLTLQEDTIVVESTDEQDAQ